MATTSQSTLRAYYTWGDSEFSWESPQSGAFFGKFGIYDHESTTTETVNVADSRTNNISKCHNTIIGIGDVVTTNVVAKLSEIVLLSETYWDNIRYLMHFVENLQFNDGVTFIVNKNNKESLVITEKRSANLSKPVSELLVMSELFLHKFAAFRQHNELVWLDETFTQTPGKISNEYLSIVEDVSHDIIKAISEVLNMADMHTHKSKVKRTISEAINVLERFSSTYGDYQEESFKLMDAFLRACQGVIADVGIYDDSIELDDFLKMIKQPSGYEPFIPYVVGEYEYEKALVRLLVKAGSMGSQPAIYDAVVNVDIDDTIDRGTVDITDTSAATKVYFNKHYYTKPEVSVTLQGGNTGDGTITPRIGAISSDDDGFYFTVELIKGDGTRAQGRVTWNSVGY